MYLCVTEMLEEGQAAGTSATSLGWASERRRRQGDVAAAAPRRAEPLRRAEWLAARPPQRRPQPLPTGLAVQPHAAALPAGPAPAAAARPPAAAGLPPARRDAPDEPGAHRRAHLARHVAGLRLPLARIRAVPEAALALAHRARKRHSQAVCSAIASGETSCLYQRSVYGHPSLSLFYIAVYVLIRLIIESQY